MTVPTPNPLRIVYDELYRLSMAGHTTSCSHVRELLKSIGLSNMWEYQKILVSAESINQLKSLVKVELERYYTRNWLKDINDAENIPSLEPTPCLKKNSVWKPIFSVWLLKNINKLSPISKSAPTD